MSRISKTFAALLAAYLSTHAGGQGVTTLDGKWTASFTSPNRSMAGAWVVINGGEGTWKTQGAPRDNPCFGKETPLTIDQSSTESVTMKILYSKLMAGCQDASLSVKLENGILKGQFGNGNPVVLTRE
jgi:hypothetical protein